MEFKPKFGVNKAQVGSKGPPRGRNQAPKQWHQKFNDVVLSNGYLLNQADKCVYTKIDGSGKGVIICLYVDDMLIFGTNQVQVNLTKEFLPLRFSMKEMGKANVILGIRIKHESNGIAISQSHYIEKVLKKFNYSDCTPASTPLDTYEKLMPNKGPVHRQAIKRVLKYLKKTIDYRLVYSGYPSVLKGYTDASWIRNTKDNSSISGSATLAKAYSQMYNGKSRHLGVRHNMILELITNEVVSIEFVRSQQNLVDHLTKALARDLVIKSSEEMELKSN
nr:zinc finger, CCHC-type [Tanacetum cinerariifolium]